MKTTALVAILGLATAVAATPLKRDVEWTEKYVKPEARESNGPRNMSSLRLVMLSGLRNMSSLN
ncbi:uncharacterized protein ASPGLDRAFT_53561, partial [Aspergillus glaucus CBS 516.65]